MFFSAFKGKCSVCQRAFQSFQSVDSSDQDSLRDALALSEFKCKECSVKFHGMCGKVGQANPQNATVTCPVCYQRIKHSLPFKVKLVKKMSAPQVGDRADTNNPLE